MKTYTDTQTREEFNELKERKQIKIIPDFEKKQYIEWHKNAYQDDLQAAQATEKTSPRWTIISGYYAMHDITKAYLAQALNIKFSAEHVHDHVITALKFALQDPEQKELAIKLLQEAQEIYNWQETPFKEKIIPKQLEAGTDERRKSQYYTEQSYDQLYAERAKKFLQDPVKPYIELFKKMLEKKEQ